MKVPISRISKKRREKTTKIFRNIQKQLMMLCPQQIIIGEVFAESWRITRGRHTTGVVILEGTIQIMSG